MITERTDQSESEIQNSGFTVKWQPTINKY